jgi:hypothetical protein
MRARDYQGSPSDEFMGDGWKGHTWSDWEPLAPYVGTSAESGGRTKRLPETGPCLYRIRRGPTSNGRQSKDLLYIGETGSSLRSRWNSRLTGLRRAGGIQRTYTRSKAGPEAKAPKPTEWERSLARYRAAQISWTTNLPNGQDKRYRKGLEADLISSYRSARGQNPLLQFGLGAPDQDEVIEEVERVLASEAPDSQRAAALELTRSDAPMHSSQRSVRKPGKNTSSSRRALGSKREVQEEGPRRREAKSGAGNKGKRRLAP